MNANPTENRIHATTYDLLVRSEEKERSLFETLAYGLFILSAVAAICQCVLQAVNLPIDGMRQTVFRFSRRRN